MPVDNNRWEYLPDGSRRRRQRPPGQRPEGATAPLTSKDTEPVTATPGALELAAEKGIDISTLTGTGKYGKVTKADVEKAAE